MRRLRRWNGDLDNDHSGSLSPTGAEDQEILAKDQMANDWGESQTKRFLENVRQFSLELLTLLV